MEKEARAAARVEARAGLRGQTSIDESNRKEDEGEGEKSNTERGKKKRETYGTIKGCILWCCMRAT